MILGLTWVGSAIAAEKRVEDRGTPAEVRARAAGPTPGKAPATPASGGAPGPCETHRHDSGTTDSATVEEIKTVERWETVVVEAPPIVIEAPRYAAIPELLQDTLGRPKAATVSACLDPRYPLPSYAWVGLVPAFAEDVGNDEVRLQRLEFELEVEAGWQVHHSVFTLVVGPARFELAVSQELLPETLWVSGALGGRRYPVIVGATRTDGRSPAGRCRISFDFTAAGAGAAPILRSGDGLFLSADLTTTAPPGSVVPKFVLVPSHHPASTRLALVEKSGTTTSVIPALNELELAASCIVVRMVRY